VEVEVIVGLWNYYKAVLQAIKSHELMSMTSPLCFCFVCYIPFSMSSQLFLIIFLHSLFCEALF
jgi:hypothetical protein